MFNPDESESHACFSCQGDRQVSLCDDRTLITIVIFRGAM